MKPTDEIASSGPAGARAPRYAARYGPKSAQRSSLITAWSWPRSTASGHTSQVHRASMPIERSRLIARRIVSVRELPREDRPRRVIEQPHDRGVTELLVDPGQAGGGLLQIADLMGVGGDAARQA